MSRYACDHALTTTHKHLCSFCTFFIKKKTDKKEKLLKPNCTYISATDLYSAHMIFFFF